MEELFEEKKCCGTCKHHYYGGEDHGYVCLNKDSEYFTDETEYSHSCDDWEER